ncbi:hypothetical protein E2C01_095703 [Portunus trituberculatus]|uniref:Uncharacterized protein n=1 Tax=Portunus trituberculatus TaxID=210409 RepID=A0A5B7JVY7_PORTR|nr:hypothetical protein [Portunus trituberculatus]
MSERRVDVGLKSLSLCHRHSSPPSSQSHSASYCPHNSSTLQYRVHHFSLSFLHFTVLPPSTSHCPFSTPLHSTACLHLSLSPLTTSQYRASTCHCSLFLRVEITVALSIISRNCLA